MSILLTARYTIKPGNAEAVEAALRRIAPLVQQHEPGCLRYQVSRSAEDPNRLLLIEEYADQAAVDAHMATAHFKEIILGTVVPLLEKREREFFTPVIGA